MKKILGLMVAALLVIMMVGGGTWAYFSDTETSTGNVLTAGTLDLKLSDDNETDQDGVTASWGDANMAPGDDASGTVTLTNSGSLEANHVEITFANVIDNTVTPAEIGTDDEDMSDTMNVTALSLGVTDLLAVATGAFVNADIELADVNDDQVITLDELDGVTIDDLTPPAADGGTTDFDITVELDTATGNGNQGDQVTTSITFVMFQDATQNQ
jgi:predicted ribosomally synthesized peptide with SipW-like signal peptide